MSDTDPSGRDPYEDRLNRVRVRERMSADYGDEEAPPPQRKRPARRAGGLLGADPTTRRLAYGAAGLGGLLVLGIGGWALLGHQQTGIPVLGPPPGPVRVRPVDPGGMQVLGAEAPTGDDGAVARLAPGPEQPRPDRLAQQYGQPPATDAATAPATTPAATPPAAASVSAPTSAPVSEAPLASPAASPAPAAAVPGSGAALPPPSAWAAAPPRPRPAGGPPAPPPGGARPPRARGG
ncbi:MAG: SPOR domain-containing protein, partial [Gluconacetobacter sp.]